MRMRSLLLAALFSCLCFVPALAQQREITGTVVNATTNEPLNGVSILSDKKGSNATTGTDGKYTIRVDAGAGTLIFSYVGFTTQTVRINGRSSVNISLQQSTAALDEVVVVGYGTQRKSHLTGAISKYQNEKLADVPVARLDQALQGKIAGVQIQNLSSEAGSEPRVRVRGQTSIYAGADPLVVVDGHPVPDGLSFVNMADVQSVEVLKDAASAAIYGSRGASGVILITTKAGRSERPKYSVKVSTGVRQAYAVYPMLTMTEYANLMFYEASLRAKDPSITVNPNFIANNERAGYVIENTLLNGQGTDWQQEALRNANVKNIQLAVSGGKQDFRYYLSGGYQRDQGLMHHSEYDKFSIRAKFDANLGKRVKINFNFNPSYIKREQPSVNFMDFVRFYSFLPVYHTAATAAYVNQAPQWASIKPGDWAQARHFNGLVYTGTMPDGSFWNTTSASQPFSTANNTPKSIMENASDNTNEYRVASSGEMTVNLLKGLDFKTLASVYVSVTNRLRYDKKGARSEGSTNTGIYNDRTYIDLLSENTLNYNKKFGEHSLSAVAGFTTQRTNIGDQQVTAYNYPSDNITTLNSAGIKEQDPTKTFNLKNTVGLNSLLGRVNYSFMNRYLLSASFRTDGSSKFAPGKRWGNFPAASLGWVVTEEKFMRNVRFIDQLKLRASYGVTGNNRILDFAWLDLLYPSSYPFGGGTGTANPAQIPSQTILANDDITWERTFQNNYGIDLGFFGNRVNLSVDYYQSKSDQLLLQQEIQSFAGNTRSWNNIGQLRNRGLELELNTTNLRMKNFRWTTSANLSRNRNKILNLDQAPFLTMTGEREDVYRNIVGGPLVQFYGFRTDGVFMSQREADSFVTAGYTSTLSTSYFTAGGLKLRDINGDKKIDQNDRTVIGNPYPDFTWGITNNLSYKGLDLSFMLQGSQGGQLVNGDAGYNETKRTNKNYIADRWISPMFPGDGRTPYFTNGNVSWVATDYMVEDASYWALREVIIGYTLPNSLLKRIKLSSARIYFSAQNLHFQSAAGYRGINPEARLTGGVYNTPLIDGYQRGSFPMPKTYMFGLDLNF